MLVSRHLKTKQTSRFLFQNNCWPLCSMYFPDCCFKNRTFHTFCPRLDFPNSLPTYSKRNINSFAVLTLKIEGFPKQYTGDVHTPASAEYMKVKLSKPRGSTSEQFHLLPLWQPGACHRHQRPRPPESLHRAALRERCLVFSDADWWLRLKQNCLEW